MSSGEQGAPPGLLFFQPLQEHVVSNHCPLYNEYAVYNMARNMSCTMWSEVCKKKVEDIDINGMPGWSCGAMGAGAVKSTFKHPLASMGFPAFLRFGTQNVVDYYKGILFYQSLYWKQHDNITFWTRGVISGCEELSSLHCVYLRGSERF